METTVLACGIGAAILIGIAKTGIPGAGILMVPLLSMAFPGKRVVGILLPMLLAGDIFAVLRYHRHTDWKKLLKLFPFVVPGLAAGFLLLIVIDKTFFKPFLGGLILVLIMIEIVRRKCKWEKFPDTWWFSAVFGFLGGFATAIGHAAGPVMGIYLLSRKSEKEEFMGTRAWFFFIVNTAKIPVYIPAGILTDQYLTFNLTMAPFIVIGVLLGFYLLPKVPQKAFNAIVLILAAAAAIKMFF